MFFPVRPPNFSLKPFVTIPVAPITTGIITHFMFHIRYISVHKLLHFLFSAPYYYHHQQLFNSRHGVHIPETLICTNTAERASNIKL